MRYAIVTGAASGLGREIAVQLGRLGWGVALVDLDLGAAHETRKLVEEAGGTARVERMDVTRESEWHCLRERLRTEWPRLDLLVNNAGVGGAGRIDVMPERAWQLIFETNLFGALRSCRALLDWLKANPNGAHILNVASAAGLMSAPSMAAYSASKAALVSLSETLSAELRSDRIGVTVVCPGFFASRLLERGLFAEESDRLLAEDLTLRAPFDAADVARAALRGYRRGRLYVVMGRRARWLWRLKRLAPQRFAAVMSEAYRRLAMRLG